MEKEAEEDDEVVKSENSRNHIKSYHTQSHQLLQLCLYLCMKIEKHLYHETLC